MATPLTDGHVYVIDTAPGSSDPDNYDMDTWGLTEGTDYIDLEIPQTIVDKLDDNKLITPLANETSVIQALGYYLNTVLVSGLISESTIANNMTKIQYVKTFYNTKNKDTGALYLVIKFGTNVYWPFYDTVNSTIRQYSKGTFHKPGPMHRMMDGNPLTILSQFGWFEKW